MRSVTRDGVTFRVRDEMAVWAQFWDQFEAGSWEPQTTALFDDILRPGKLLVDFGAWIGPTALWAANRGARVIAIEPDPVAREALEDNIAANDFDELVDVVAGAISTQTGSAHLYHAPVGEFGDARSRLTARGITVRTWTLPDLLAEKGISPEDVSLVKMDVEGLETMLCPTLGPWLAEHGISAMIELHGGYPEPQWFADFGVVRYPAGALVVRP